MRIALTCPAFTPHGGIRVILEWANRLAERGHEVVIRSDDPRKPDWFGLGPAVEIASEDSVVLEADCLIVCSPHAVEYLERDDGPTKRFAFLQMAEHLFRPEDHEWRNRCRRFYRTPYPMFLISRWNEQVVRMFGRTGEMHYVGNGVNLDHFPVERPVKDGRTVLVEGWYPGNPTKDSDRIAAKVAKKLRRAGYRIVAFGLGGLKRDPYRTIPHEYHKRPSLEQMNDLYRRATILLKATHCDARSCAPLEAMTKGAVTVRAIERGDDDLVHGENCLRVPYDEGSLYRAALTLLNDEPLRLRLASNGRDYVQRYTWDYWIDQVEGVLTAPARIAA